MVLLEPGEGYLIILGGLETLYPRTGDVVAQGTALGTLPGGLARGGDEFVQDDPVSVRSETLYVETRENGQAIDPARWFDLTGQ